MSYIGYVPAAKPLTSADITDGVITSAKIADGTIVNADIATAAAIATTKLGAGAVLQVVSATYDTQQTTTSNSYVTSNLTVSITPSSSSNKILVFASAVIATSGTATHTGVTLYRNSTNLSTDDSMAHSYGNAGSVRCNIGVHYLDSPATTSSTSYTIYFKAGSGVNTQTIHVDNSMSVITALEIKG